MGPLLALGLVLSGMLMMVSRRLGSHLLTVVVIAAIVTSLLPPVAAGVAQRVGASTRPGGLFVVALLLALLIGAPVLRGLSPWILGAIKARADRRAELARMRRSRRARIEAPIPMDEQGQDEGVSTERTDGEPSDGPTISRWLS